MYDDFCIVLYTAYKTVFITVKMHCELQMLFFERMYIASIAASRYHEFVRDIAITRKTPVLPLPNKVNDVARDLI
jgi:hypothetical protein